MIEAPVKKISSKSAGVMVIRNDKGLHTRPSTELVKCATRFRSDILLTYQRNQVNAKSILGILMLAAPRGARIKILALGEDAEEAVQALEQLAVDQFYIQY